VERNKFSKILISLSQMKIPQFNISGWYILILCIIGTFLSYQGLSMYGTAHWALVRTSYQLESRIEGVSTNTEALKLLDSNANLKSLMSHLPTIAETIKESGWSLLAKSAKFRLFGLTTILVLIFSFFVVRDGLDLFRSLLGYTQ
jgi:predicted PurR-regulated permease PerM